MILVGEHAHTLDDKNRVILPASFRAAYADGVVICRGFDGCLFVYPVALWERTVEDRLAQVDPLSQEGRQLQRFFFSGAVLTELDRQGRVTLPQALLKAAGVSKFVTIVGVGGFLEIWDDRSWRGSREAIEGSAEAVAARLMAAAAARKADASLPTGKRTSLAADLVYPPKT